MPTARIEGKIDRLIVEGRRVSYEVERSGTRVVVWWVPEEGGCFPSLFVPAGRGVLRGPAALREPGAVLAELDLAPGETRRIDVE